MEAQLMTARTPEEKEYEDIPGTFVFDAERSRQGYGINMFCMSLMKDENRKAFKANEAGYLKKFRLTPEQEEAILTRNYNRMLELGGNIYFTAKLGATDGHSFQHLAAVMTGSTQQDYADMMLGGGRSVEGNRSKSGRITGPTAIARAKPRTTKARTAKAKSAKAKSAQAKTAQAKTAKARSKVKAAAPKAKAKSKAKSKSKSSAKRK
jgi:protocatechuate 4,5-dioxygenase alpha chain